MHRLFSILFSLTLCTAALAQNTSAGPVTKTTAGAQKDEIREDLTFPAARKLTLRGTFEWDGGTFTGASGFRTAIGLGNVNNTSDAAKPISTATQTALDAKQPLDADLTAWAGVNPSSYSTTAQIAAAYQPLDSDLTNIAANTTGGFLTRTAANTYTPRTITGTTGQITVTNGDGVSGNPTISLPSTITQATTFSANLTSSARITSTVTGTTLLDFFQANNTTGRMLDIGTNGAGQAYLSLRDQTATTRLTLTGDGSGNFGAATASTSTTSGALVIGSNVGLSGNLGGPSYFGGHVSLAGAGTGARYVALLGEVATYAGQLALQAGGGSAGFGGGLVMYGHSHASFPGWVKAGISNGSGGKFSVNANGIGTSTDVFTVDAGGAVVASGGLTAQTLRATGTNSAESYPLTVVNNATKATTGNYVGLLVSTSDASAVGLGLAFFGHATPASRYWRLGAFDNGGTGWQTGTLMGAVTFDAGSITGGASGLTFNAGGAAQNITLAPSTSGRVQINYSSNLGTSQLQFTNTNTAPVRNGIILRNDNSTNTASRNWALTNNDVAYGDFSIKQSSTVNTDPLSGTAVFYITPSSNVLIGGTTDITGTAGLKVFGTTVASNTTSGALQVAGGGGFGGNVFVGGTLNAASNFTLSNGWTSATYSDAGTADVFGTLSYSRMSSGTVANGFGQKWAASLEDAAGNSRTASELETKWTDASNYLSRVVLRTRNGVSGLVDALTLSSTGAATFSSTITTALASTWDLGAASVTTLTSLDRSLRVKVDGTDYYIPAKLTNN